VTHAVQVAVPDAEAELAADALWQAGAVAIEERPGLLIAATTDGRDPAALVEAVAGRWPAEVVAVDVEAALDAWREHARPVVIADRLVVRPPWVEPPPAAIPAPPGHCPRNCEPNWLPGNHAGSQLRAQRSGKGDALAPGTGDELLDVVVDPGRAFGGGAHVSTRLALAALVELVRGGERVLDVGCGSGVLALAALALGADEAVGIDIDPEAVEATRANAERNRVADRLVVATDLPAAGPASPYDLVVANMLLPDLVAVAPTVARVAGRHAAVVISGVLTDQRAAVLAPYAGLGLEPVAERTDEGWLALTLRVGRPAG
jgi:ribosomal protein L11 methylase PrmA